MSTIYSAGQYDDAFTPKRLGNWESTAKESFPFRKTPKLFTPKVIVDSRGHLLPWVPRGDKASSWGLLNLHLRSKYNRTRSMVFMSGPGKQTSTSGGGSQSSASIQKRLKKLPKFAPRKIENSPPPDLLLEYLQHLSLPIVWIIGPPTRNTFQKRKQFAKQLASFLGFGYVNLDDKIQEWKERQQICTCGSSPSMTNAVPPLSPPHGPLHSLASTSIAPSKLPTNVPPFISPNIPSPPATTEAEANEYILNILESQRITFDTALPIERNKILELFKFAMAECLPCEGFVTDAVPFDLVEGLQFEKVFYPAALAIYFTEGAPQRKQKLKPKDRRVTASTATSMQSAKKITMSPMEYLERSRKHGENVYLKTKSHKRLGVFNLAEGEKICKQFGSKTIRIINAEDVERDTMEFLNELVKKNLDRYQDVLEGTFQLDLGIGGHLIPCTSSDALVAPGPPSSTYSSSFILEDEEKELEELERMARLQKRRTPTKSNLPPALVTAHHSETSLFTLPNIFNASEHSSMASSAAASPRSLPRDAEEPIVILEEKDASKEREPIVVDGDNAANNFPPHVSAVKPGFIPEDSGGAGDHDPAAHAVQIPTVLGGRKSAELWERIVKLETKVAELGTPEETRERDSKAKVEFDDVDNVDIILRPPTAYAEEGVDFDKVEEERFTAAIRNAIGPAYVAAASVASQQHREFPFAPPQSYLSGTPPAESVDYDYGASGDCGGHSSQEHYQHHPHFQQQERRPFSPEDNRQKKKSQEYEEDPFFDE